MASFGPVAPHYDLLMHQIPYPMWAGYYRLLLEMVESRPKRVLDVCCGTGTLAEILHGMGFQVEGVDLSEAMIQVARQKASDKGLDIPYSVADATTLDLGRTFEGAYSFFDSLNYITTLEGFCSALASVSRHLEPGAWFIFDLNTSYAFEQKMFDQHDLRKKAAIQYDWKGHYDLETRIIRVEMQFWRDGEPFQEVHVQRAHNHDEVMDALAAAGLGKTRVFDSYTLDLPGKDTDRVHYLAQKMD